MVLLFFWLSKFISLIIQYHELFFAVLFYNPYYVIIKFKKKNIDHLNNLIKKKIFLHKNLFENQKIDKFDQVVDTKISCYSILNHYQNKQQRMKKYG